MDELIKALRRCWKCPCDANCPRYEKALDVSVWTTAKCALKLQKDSADAIERLQSDIAKKDSQLAEWKNAWRIANSLYKSAQSEIDELRAYQHELIERIETLKAELSELKQNEQNGPNEPKGDSQQ